MPEDFYILQLLLTQPMPSGQEMIKGHILQGMGQKSLKIKSDYVVVF